VLLTDQTANPELHFFRCRICKRQGQYGEWRDTIRNQVGDPIRQNARFSRACASNYHQWTVQMFGCDSLGIVQFF
jgi:hypothetical protein